MKCIAAIDQGTSSSRVLLIDISDGTVIASHQIAIKQNFPSPGWVEQDPMLIWTNVQHCMTHAIHKANEKVSAGSHTKGKSTSTESSTHHSPGPVEVIAIGITNQRETTIVWNRHSGLPYHPAILWNDTRTQTICNRQLLDRIAAGDKDYFRTKTGLPIATYFSASKLLYLLDAVPDSSNIIARDAERGDALFGTVDTWLVWQLTGGLIHATDVTNASRTMLMNLSTLDWDKEILDMLKIPREMLPIICPSSSPSAYGKVSLLDIDAMHDKQLHFSKTAGRGGFHGTRLDPCYDGVPITGILGDQQAALFGQACFSPGDVKCTYGTGAFLLANTGNEIVPSNQGLVTTVAYQLQKHDNTSNVSSTTGKAVYALEGSVAYCGALVNWLKDNLHLVNSAKDTESLARSLDRSNGTVNDSGTVNGTESGTVSIQDTAHTTQEVSLHTAKDETKGNGGLYIVPAFAGLYAPHWQPNARGAVLGLTAYHTKAHLVRASLESAAFQTADVCASMARDLSQVYDYGIVGGMLGKWWRKRDSVRYRESEGDGALTSTYPSLSSTLSHSPWKELRVDGGLANNDWLMQFQCDLLDLPLIKPMNTETTAMGAGMIAGIGVGVWKDEEEVKKLLWKQEKVWTPSMTKQERVHLVSCI